MLWIFRPIPVDKGRQSGPQTEHQTGSPRLNNGRRYDVMVLTSALCWLIFTGHRAVFY